MRKMFAVVLGVRVIMATVPAGATAGLIKIYINGLASNQDVSFIMPNPVVTELSPSFGLVSTQVRVKRHRFRSNAGSTSLTFCMFPSA